MNRKKIELLSPARDLECGIAAVDCGADAVYVGAPKFGARAGAGNELGDIRRLIDYAHTYWAKVYVTVNTILYEDELTEARELILDLHAMNADAVIFQDMALLEMELPPIPLFASTQTHNYEIDRIRMLDSLGIPRIILARELTLEQVRDIRAAVSAELEFFIHGALCVSMSGQCYMSQELSGRSANRGECAQNCRMPYSLVDRDGKTIVAEKHLLSVRDLNLSAHLKELMNAGITSFKIEGRYKDIDYVKNITAYYRQAIDAAIADSPEFLRSSSGYSIIPFAPDPERTFNRGYTEYFLHDRNEPIGAHDSPKSTGKYLGRVTRVTERSFTLSLNETVVNGDGICYLDHHNEMRGMFVNKVEGNTIFTQGPHAVEIGTKIYRNHDHAFGKELQKPCVRKIRARIALEISSKRITLSAVDEDDVSVSLSIPNNFPEARIQAVMQDAAIKQLAKAGATIFTVTDIAVNAAAFPFVPVKTFNNWRRNLLALLETERRRRYRVPEWRPHRNAGLLNIPKKLDYSANVVNSLSEKFYRERGAEEIQPGYELMNDYAGTTVMTCKYCIKDELDACPLESDKRFNEPLYLVGNARTYRLVFNCADCLMHIVKE
jgi:putative protease